MWFLNWRAEDNLVANTNDNKVFLSRNYRSDSSPSEVWGTFAREASISFKNIKFPWGNCQSDSSSTETLESTSS